MILDLLEIAEDELAVVVAPAQAAGRKHRGRCGMRGLGALASIGTSPETGGEAR
jgi:hypothetical protein